MAKPLIMKMGTNTFNQKNMAKLLIMKMGTLLLSKEHGKTLKS
jgi:hypothetical protein